jgi:hypothetical protein
MYNHLLALRPHQIRPFDYGLGLRVGNIAHIFRVQSDNVVTDLKE